MYKPFVLMVGLLLLGGCDGGSGGGSSFNASSDAAPGVESGFRVDGELFLEANSEQDADIQSRGMNRAVAQNDSFETAQQIDNPTTLGGYLSFNNGRYFNGEPYLQDRVDIYSLPALARQSVKFRILHADQAARDPDKRLPPVIVQLQIFSQSNTTSHIYSEHILREGVIDYEFAADGDYFIRLSAISAYSSPIIYQVDVSSELASGLRLNNGYKALASDSIVMRMANGAVFRTPASVSGSSGSEALAKLQSIRSAGFLEPFQDIVVAEPEYLVTSTDLGVNDRFSSEQWNLEIIGFPETWAAASGAGVRVAVLDTGVATNHEDLQNNLDLVDGYDFVSDDSNGDGDGIDPDPSEISHDEFFHGTHVAGVIASDRNDGVGIAGIAYNSTIVPIRVLGQDGLGSSFDVAEGIRYAAGLATFGGPVISQPVDIINLSLGLDVDSELVADAVKDAVAAGVIVIASAGNDATSSPFYPAAYPEVVGVGAFNHERYRSSFSNYGVNIDLLAPGGTDGTSIFNDGIDDLIPGPGNPDSIDYDYINQIGTSFAAPHVSAVAALMKQLQPGLSPALFRSLLNQGSLTDTHENIEFYGRGLLNASKAVAAVGGVLEDEFLVFPASLSFSSNDSRVEVAFSNPGAGSVEIVSVSFDDAWLTLGGTDVDGSGLGRYSIDIDRNLIGTDIASTNISVQYRVNGGAIQTRAIPVLQYIQRTGNLDGVYVYLVPREEAESNVAEVPVYRSQLFYTDAGQYVFDFGNVARGSYFLEASTDNDGDGQLFDPGEAIGAYRLSNSADALEVSGARRGLSFTISYENFYERQEFRYLPVRSLP